MVLPLYLALTAAEFTACSQFPANPAWMACHFSPYGTGLCNLPPVLSGDAMLILNDRIPPAGIDAGYILDQLARINCGCILLDFQREGNPETERIVRAIVESESRPVGVTPQYVQTLTCPVFLPPVPIDIPLAEYLAPWQGREIWLEAAMDSLCYSVTEQGSSPGPLFKVPDRGLRDDELFCHYHVETFEAKAEFSLWRTREDLDGLLNKAQSHGVTRAVGLWQELA